MKNNTEKVKNLLFLALQTTPDDFSLQEVKNSIRQALLKIENIEKKRLRRETTQAAKNNQWPVVNGQVVNPYAIKQTLDSIDDMISAEKLRIEEIANRRKGNDGGESDDVQTIFG